MPKQKTGEPKYCAACAKLLERKRINERMEDFGIFSRRKYCDRSCMSAGQVKSEVGRSAHLARVRHLKKDNCEMCGTKDRLTHHHKDRNWANDSPDNLMTLCNSCHTSLHHAAGEISPRRINGRCKFCGKESLRISTCSTCKTRIRTHGVEFCKRKAQETSLRLAC